MKWVIFVLSMMLLFKPVTAKELSVNQANQIREMFEGIIGGFAYRHEHNYCRVIKNLGKDAVSCEIYQTFVDGKGNKHSELATRIDLDYIENEEPPIAKPSQIKQINDYDVQIWYDKIYAGPRSKEILMTTYVIRPKQSIKITMTCWQNHKCYAEQLINQVNKQNVSRIIGRN